MTLRQGILQTRDARQGELQRAMDRAGSEDAASVLVISTNVPGGNKHRPGLSGLVQGAVHSLQEVIGLKKLLSRTDLLGPFQIVSSGVSPMEAKMAALTIETENPSGRILDVDVFTLDGSQIDRARLGLPPRACFVCLEPAHECARLGRHSDSELLERVDSLLQPFVPAPQRVLPDVLAKHLVRGALSELDLTPKPGLVDRHDSGSHPDLSYAAMRTSAELLPQYFDDLLRCFSEKRPLAEYVQAGIAAEGRMNREIHANAHKGFIFLSGLVLLAACECDGQISHLRQAISDIGTRFFAHSESSDSHGADIRTRHALGGIRAEAEQGLPAVFEHGWPRYREALEAGWDPEHAGFYLMATLMQRVEDTTAIHRCGLEGLTRLRRDGAHLQRLLERQQAPATMLAELNAEYCQLGLTMGGVADCMALTFALQATAR